MTAAVHEHKPQYLCTITAPLRIVQWTFIIFSQDTRMCPRTRSICMVQSVRVGGRQLLDSKQWDL